MHIVTVERKHYKTITDLTLKGKHTFMDLLSLHVDFSQKPDLKTYSIPIFLKYKIKILHHWRGKCSCGVVDNEQKTDKRCGVAFRP